MYNAERIRHLYSLLFKKSLPHGAIIAVDGKDNLYGSVKGDVIKNGKNVHDKMANYSHFTPNTFIKLRTNNELVWGHSEDHLHAINAFVFDIDTKKYTANQIATHCMEQSIGVPTYILQTDKGLQFAFVLTESIYVNQSKKSIYMAKQIHRNIRDSLLELDVDVACLPFGFFRAPSISNVLLYSEQTYDAAALMNWSIGKESDRLVASEQILTVYRGGLIKHRPSKWYQAILNTKSVKGSKGMLGRNNVLFTLSLACFQDGVDIEDAQAELLQWNASLSAPLKKAEVLRTIGSAYSSKYNGPAKEYVDVIMTAYCPHTVNDFVASSKTYYKHAKERADRTRSHIAEWETDIIAYVEEQLHAQAHNGFFITTQSALMEALNIPSSTLNLVLKQSTKLIRKSTGKGRAARTHLSTVKCMVQHILTNVSSRAPFYTFIITDLVAGLECNPGKELLYKYFMELGIPIPTTSSGIRDLSS